MAHYPDVNPNPNFPELEEKILAFWQEQHVFKQSVDERAAILHDGEPAGERAISARSADSSESQQTFTESSLKNNEFIFYDGPPFANGLPHYGHLLTGYVKDAIARYQTMQGKRVERRFGWDCHGLPAEMGSEKELGISGRAAITEFGIGKFNEHCRTSVMKYTNEWEDYVNRQARWVDFKNDYKTMDKNFMESVLWAFKQLYDKGLVYEAYRVMPYSWAAETPLSNFETKLDNSYREREDKAITVAFELCPPLDAAHPSPPASGGGVGGGIWEKLPKADKYYVLAWTTTPWTLPSNLALAVSKATIYTCVVKDGIGYICSDAAAMKLFGDYIQPVKNSDFIQSEIDEISMRHKIIGTGEHLIDLTYKPLFPYFANHKNAFRILDGSSFVTDGDGTGIVHMAPGFGEEDQKCCEANGIELVVPVDGQGKYTDAIFDISVTPAKAGVHVDAGIRRHDEIFSLKGLNVIADIRKDESEPYTETQLKKFGLANLRIINYLKQKGQLIKQEDFKHNYPHCWRTDQPLIYRAMPSWYVEVTKFRDRAVEINKQINWIPEHIRDGQMAHMLATAPDWSISRNRFWGTPIPVWRAKSGKVIVIGSIEELEKLSGKKVADLHRPYIDEISIEKDGETYTRVEDVFDCWFESGSMPFAQVHYPFENKEWFETHFPADFITEYVGQTRGWFNTLIMLSTALFDKPPFLNCICHGVVLDAETGLKYSKRLKNYKDPMEVMDQFGADALRWLMLSSPVMRGHDLAVDPEGKFIRDVVRLAIKPIWNAYNFFCMYANADGVKAKYSTDSSDIMDRYILAKCDAAVAQIQTAMDAYDVPASCDAVMQFFEVLNNWYIRRSKERFWSEEKSDSKQAAYDTLYTVLATMCRAAAPLLPLTLEEIYKGLTGDKTPSPSGRGGGEGYTYQPEKLIENARNLRKNSTDVEKILWSILRDRQLAGFKFRRQHPVEKYVLDFYCDSAKLAIELDGGQHNAEQSQSYDENRTKFLESHGISVLRFWNNDILENIEGVYETIVKALQESAPSPNPLPEGEGFNSVHLAAFPSVMPAKAGIHVDPGLRRGDVELIAQMDFIQSICNTTLAIRNKQNIRVRQPLLKLEILAASDAVNSTFVKYESNWASYYGIIMDEVNVKIVHPKTTNLDEYTTLKLSINSQVLGKRLPAMMKQILPASKKDEWVQKDGTVEICGEKLLPEEYTLQLEPKPEYASRAQALSTNDALVILDTEITPELKREGLARDLVRAIQQARKDAGLHIADRIELSISGEVDDVLSDANLNQYIKQQTLASTLSNEKLTNPIYETSTALEDISVNITLKKAA